MVRQRIRFVTALSLLLGVLACSPAPATKTIPTEGFGGIWVMNLGQKTFAVLTLEKAGDTFSGTLSLPGSFQTSTGRRFSRFNTEVVNETVATATVQGDRLHLVTRDSKNDKDTNEYDMVLNGQDAASLKLADLPIEPWPFTRVRSTTVPVVSTDWEPRRSYSLDDNAASSAVMQRIYDEDQLDRKDFAQFSKEAQAIGREDEERRAQTRTLLAEGQLHTSEDFTRAAFVFQHGNTPDDFLLAHTFAMVAAAKGDEEALWIGTATLDRYLHATGKPQVFGTQIKEKADHTATLEPYNRSLVSDTLRRELGVQPIAAQEGQLQNWTDQFKAAATAKPK